jgi:hypothetical protein
LLALIKKRGDGVHAYYYGISLEITLERHDMRPQKAVFAKEDMTRWYNADNKLNLPNERIFDEHISVEDAIAKILADCGEVNAL